jgi:hypothetical protein
MQEARVRSDPQSAIAIPEKGSGIYLSRGKGKRLGLPVHQPPDSAAQANQHLAVVAFAQRVDGKLRVWHPVEFRSAWFPSPQVGEPAGPEIARAVLIQGANSWAETAIFSVATRLTAMNRAESSAPSCIGISPDRSFTILKELHNSLSSKLRVLSQLAVFPTGQPFIGANP